MMNANNSTKVFEVVDPSEVNIAKLITNEDIIRYLNTVSVWCDTMVSKARQIENEAEEGRIDDDSCDVLQAHIEKLKLFVNKIDELEKLYFNQSDIQIDHQQSCRELINTFKRGIYFALIKACWLAINISNDPKRKCSIYYSCSEYFTGAIQIHRDVICKINNDIVDKSLLLAVYIKILKSILQIIEAKKKRELIYQKELELLQEIKKELLDDTSKQNLGVNKKFGGFLQTVESVLTKNRLTDKSEETNEDLDKLVREIQGNETLEKNGLQNNVRKKSKKKKRNKRANKKSDRETKDEMKPIKTADFGGFLAALSISLKQLKEHQNKNSGQAHVNLSKNTESTGTENNNLPLSNLFNAEEAKRLLQDRWENVEKEAENSPEKVTIVNCDEQPSFTNK